MTIKELIKILDNKIEQNRADYDLYRENAKISAWSSGELNKYEYLSDEDLGYRPRVLEKAKFEYFPLGEVFNKGLDKSVKQEGLLKRLKNIEDKTDNQLKAIEGQRDKQLVPNGCIDMPDTKQIEFIDDQCTTAKELKHLKNFIDGTIDVNNKKSYYKEIKTTKGKKHKLINIILRNTQIYFLQKKYLKENYQ